MKTSRCRSSNDGGGNTNKTMITFFGGFIITTGNVGCQSVSPCPMQVNGKGLSAFSFAVESSSMISVLP